MASKLVLAAALFLGGVEGLPGDCVQPERTESIFKLSEALPFNQCNALCADNGLVMPCLADVEENYQYLEFAWLDGCASKTEARWADDAFGDNDCAVIDALGAATGNGDAGFWATVTCEEKRPCYCEFPRRAASPYMRVFSFTDFASCGAKCEALGMGLPCVRDLAENEALVEALVAQGEQITWLGARRRYEQTVLSSDIVVDVGWGYVAKCALVVAELSEGAPGEWIDWPCSFPTVPCYCDAGYCPAETVFRLGVATTRNDCAALCTANGLRMPCITDLEANAKFVDTLTARGNLHAWLGLENEPNDATSNAANTVETNRENCAVFDNSGGFIRGGASDGVPGYWYDYPCNNPSANLLVPCYCEKLDDGTQ
ncbi:hypothetical protein M885DRAFT_567469, partial [Pelagophyceae sp. CCMP2097]